MGCSENAICTNKSGEAQCDCKQGFEGDGKSCVRIGMFGPGQRRLLATTYVSEEIKTATYYLKISAVVVLIMGLTMTLVYKYARTLESSKNHNKEAEMEA